MLSGYPMSTGTTMDCEEKVLDWFPRQRLIKLCGCECMDAIKSNIDTNLVLQTTDNNLCRF